MNYLRQQLLMTLQEVLLDDGRPYCSHYGAVMGLTELGPEVTICAKCTHTTISQNGFFVAVPKVVRNEDGNNFKCLWYSFSPLVPII